MYDFPRFFPEHTVELLNIDSYSSHPTRSDQLDRQLESQGEFKMSRPARPQPLWRAERTVEYVSTTKGRPACAKRFGEGRERRWRTLRFHSGHAFSTLPQWKFA